MGDFPKPFSGNKTKKQDATAKAGAEGYSQASRLMNLAAETELMRRAMPKTRVFDFDDKLVAKEPTSKKTKEMGGPNMEAPLEFNEGLREASDLGKLDNNPKFKAAVDAAPKMISTGMAGVDPMTGMQQANQLAPSPINPTALGSMQPQIPSIAGTPQAGTYNRVMPQPAQTGLAAPLNKYKK